MTIINEKTMTKEEIKLRNDIWVEVHEVLADGVTFGSITHEAYKNMKAKIKGKWVEYDYLINSLLTSKKMVMKALEKNTGNTVIFLGRSKAIMNEEGKVEQLKKRNMFFKYI